jgi:hypothetical protein
VLAQNNGRQSLPALKTTDAIISLRHCGKPGLSLYVFLLYFLR